MTFDRKTDLLEAVELLDETIHAVKRLKVSRSSQGPLRTLSVRLEKARQLLQRELQKPYPSSNAVVELIRTVASWLAKVLIDNLQYIFCPPVRGHEDRSYGCWTRAEVLSAGCWRKAEGTGRESRHLGWLSFPGRVRQAFAEHRLLEACRGRIESTSRAVTTGGGRAPVYAHRAAA